MSKYLNERRLSFQNTSSDRLEIEKRELLGKNPDYSYFGDQILGILEPILVQKKREEQEVALKQDRDQKKKELDQKNLKVSEDNKKIMAGQVQYGEKLKAHLAQQKIQIENQRKIVESAKQHLAKVKEDQDNNRKKLEDYNKRIEELKKTTGKNKDLTKLLNDKNELQGEISKNNSKNEELSKDLSEQQSILDQEAKKASDDYVVPQEIIGCLSKKPIAEEIVKIFSEKKHEEKRSYLMQFFSETDRDFSTLLNGVGDLQTKNRFISFLTNLFQKESLFQYSYKDHFYSNVVKMLGA